MNKLIIQLRPSRQLGVLLSLAHCTAAGVLWPLALPVWIKLLSTVLLSCSLYYYLRRYVWLTAPQSVMSLTLSGRNECKLKLFSGARIHTMIEASSFVAPYMTVLCLRKKQSWRYYTVVILPDSLDIECFRQLRVWLRWKWQDAASQEQK